VTILAISPSDLEQMLYQSVVDDEFRAELPTPAVFGLSPDFSWPDPVEAQEQSTLDVALAGVDAYRCSTTCSSGPFTLVCDGSTK
jgi:hypothetical protein